ncbi:ribosome-binding protein 1-like isoform X1 [Littorina saxatilis]|uniref:ribosome-binding protein 1-like isoform X1 n=2 Tax=Littorina saxatilis TaxID=31220 RepID=UPI0038B47AA2
MRCTWCQQNKFLVNVCKIKMDIKVFLSYLTFPPTGSKGTLTAWFKVVTRLLEADCTQKMEQVDGAEVKIEIDVAEDPTASSYSSETQPCVWMSGQKHMLARQHNMEARRGRRKGNFSNAEIAVLLTKVKENHDIIDANSSDGVTTRMKEAVWKEISDAVNLISEAHRTAKNCRKKYQNLKQTSLSMTSSQSVRLATGGCRSVRLTGGTKREDWPQYMDIILDIVKGASTSDIHGELVSKLCGDGVSGDGVSGDGVSGDDSSNQTEKGQGSEDLSQSQGSGEESLHLDTSTPPCSSGPTMAVVHIQGGKAIAVTLSPSQAQHCMGSFSGRGEDLLNSGRDKGDSSLNSGAERGERSLYNSAERGERSLYNSAERGERSLYNSAERGERSLNNGAERGERSLNNGAERGERSLNNSAERKERSLNHGAERGERSLNNGAERGERSLNNGAERGERSLNKGAERGESSLNHGAEIGERSLHNGAERGEHSLNSGAGRGTDLLNSGRDRRECSLYNGAEREERSLNSGRDRRECSLYNGTERGEHSLNSGRDRRECSLYNGAEREERSLNSGRDRRECSLYNGAERGERSLNSGPGRGKDLLYTGAERGEGSLYTGAERWEIPSPSLGGTTTAGLPPGVRHSSVACTSSLERSSSDTSKRTVSPKNLKRKRKMEHSQDRSDYASLVEVEIKKTRLEIQALEQKLEMQEEKHALEMQILQTQLGSEQAKKEILEKQLNSASLESTDCSSSS